MKIEKTKNIFYLFVFMILPPPPLVKTWPPILEKKLFGVLFTDTVAVPALSSRPGYGQQTFQSNFQVFAALVADHRLRTPSTAVTFVLQPGAKKLSSLFTLGKTI